MDSKDVLHITASLSRMIGEKNMLQEMDALGWRGVESHPVAFFKGYLEGYKDEPDEQDAIDSIKDDIIRIANAYGFDLNDDEFEDIVPR